MGENTQKIDKGLVSRIYKELLHLNKKATQLKISKEKVSQGLEQIFLQRRHTNGQQAHENMLGIKSLGKRKSKPQ